jgi:hypothetical protein
LGWGFDGCVVPCRARVSRQQCNAITTSTASWCTRCEQGAMAEGSPASQPQDSCTGQAEHRWKGSQIMRYVAGFWCEDTAPLAAARTAAAAAALLQLTMQPSTHSCETAVCRDAGICEHLSKVVVCLC